MLCLLAKLIFDEGRNRSTPLRKPRLRLTSYNDCKGGGGGGWLIFPHSHLSSYEPWRELLHNSRRVYLVFTILELLERTPFGERTGGTVAREPASHQCGLSSIQTRCHMWIECVGSLLCSEGFFPGYSGFAFSSKT